MRITFGSDPHGATIVDPDGQVLGETPLSMEIAARDVAVEYTFRKPGYMAKTLSLIPNVSSPVFAVMQDERPISAPAPRAAARPRPRRAGAPTTKAGAVDDVLPPSYR